MKFASFRKRSFASTWSWIWGYPRNGWWPPSSYSSSTCLSVYEGPWPGWGRYWNFDPPQCLGLWPETLDRYISLSCLQWLPTACYKWFAYFHWPQWVTWLVTWSVTWSRSPNAGRHIGKFSLWTTLLQFSRSAQISLFSNVTKLGQVFFDNIFFGLTS